MVEAAVMKLSALQWIVEQHDRRAENEVGGSLDITILDMYARNVAASKEGVLIADERTMIQMDAVTAGFERHGLPYPSGIVLDGQAIQIDIVGLNGHRITVVSSRPSTTLPA